MDTLLRGVPVESAYPYKPHQSYPGICNATKKIEIADNYDYYKDISEAQIIALLQDGPLSTTISGDNWDTYGSGIFACPNFAAINHAVLLVGYGPGYWIVKN